MSENVKNMTEGAPGKLILFFALPLMAANIFQQFYTMVDAMVVGQIVGVRALAAVGAGPGDRHGKRPGIFYTGVSELWRR